MRGFVYLPIVVEVEKADVLLFWTVCLWSEYDNDFDDDVYCLALI